MGKLKKTKRWARHAQESATRAEEAAARAEAAAHRIQSLLADQDTNTSRPELRAPGADRPPFYTAPSGTSATPPVAELRG
jgi:hypothetical protein